MFSSQLMRLSIPGRPKLHSSNTVQRSQQNTQHSSNLSLVHVIHTPTSHIYTVGKLEKPKENYVLGTHSYIQYLSSKPSTYYDIIKRNIFMNSLYSSLPAADWILEHVITMIWTIMNSRVGILKEKKQVTHHHTNSTEMHCEIDGSKQLLKYVAKPSKARKML